MPEPGHHDAIEQLRVEREFHRSRVLATVGWIGIPVSLLGALSMLAMGMSWRDVLPMAAVGAFSGVCVALVSTGRRHLAFFVLAVGLFLTSADAHLWHAHSPVAAAYPLLIVVAASALFARSIILTTSAVVLIAMLGIRVGRLWFGFEGVDEWLSITFDLAALVVVTALFLYVDRRRADRDARLLEDALLRVEAQRRHTADLREHAERSAVVARDASEAKSQFLARVSHELRTPLNAVLGYAELIQEEGGIESSTAEDVRRIHSSAAHLLEMVDDVLDLSKIDAGRLELVPEPVPLSDLAEEVCEVVRPMMKRNRNALEVSSSAQIVDLDRSRVRQVLLNLLSNAARFTEDGTIDLEIRADVRAVELEVRDTGIGIRAERIPHLFDPFTQAEPETQHRYGGTGLGLALCDRLVRAMGGQIQVRSTPGEGSVFTVTLPHDMSTSPA